MITCFLQGRLGNQLFIISATVSTAKKNGLIPVFPNWEYNDLFKNELPIQNVVPTHHYKEPYFHYTPINLNDSLEQTKTDDKIYRLTGYFQSEQYFNNYSSLIKSLFEPKTETLKNIYEKYKSWIFSDKTCSVHVRRGDYVGNDYYFQLGSDYYEGAMFAIKNRTKVDKFIVFSDDIEWCKANFTSINDDTVFIEGNSDIEDLLLMSMCTHNIIANSSFSWWGAYLNSNPDKIIVAPSKDHWFGKTANLNVDDLYLSNWTLL